jgi:hypothetical protein
MLCYIRFEVFTAVTIKNAVFWDVGPCRSCVNQRFGGTDRLHLQGRKIRVRGGWFLARGFFYSEDGGDTFLRSHADFSTLKMEAIRSSETSVHTRSTRRHIPEDGILHNAVGSTAINHNFPLKPSQNFIQELRNKRSKYISEVGIA